MALGAGKQEVICVSSWTAYIRPVLGWGIVGLVASGFGTIGTLIALAALARLV